MRVLLDERVAALVHGCAAQLFLAMVTATAVMSSPWWSGGFQRELVCKSGSQTHARQPASRFLACLMSFLLVIAFCQVIAGALLRHVPITTLPGTFMGLVHVHLMLAGLVFLTSLVAASNVLFAPRLWGGVKKPVFLILVVIVLQLVLGFGTWMANYALPWQELNLALAKYTITAKGYWESIVITSHVATGALIICLSTLTAVRAWRSRFVWCDANEPSV